MLLRVSNFLSNITRL